MQPSYYCCRLLLVKRIIFAILGVFVLLARNSEFTKRSRESFMATLYLRLLLSGARDALSHPTRSAPQYRGCTSSCLWGVVAIHVAVRKWRSANVQFGVVFDHWNEWMKHLKSRGEGLCWEPDKGPSISRESQAAVDETSTTVSWCTRSLLRREPAEGANAACQISVGLYLFIPIKRLPTNAPGMH